ncbi:oxygenase MpaB family protein [Amycolatopsis anabasis]|uniref:oxygenase MpaB family protein n=1 Tax=Amycolatopsis anabasis TaxID=1840409 RepID=UPI00131A7B6E|nr:oxygenase MpaB family protein [Amycolatopsis anabasis]
MTAEAEVAPSFRHAEQPAPELLAPDSITAEFAGNTLVVSTIAAALIMQTMHPAIGAAVDRYSVFRTDPYGRGIRSLDSIALWVYGGPAAIEEGNRLRELHKPIKGVDEHGRRYSALNPEAYGWVHGTVFAWAVTSYPLFFGRKLTEDEEERLYQETLQLGRILRVPPKQLPPNREAYWAYYREMVATKLEKHPIADYLINELIVGPPPPPGVPKLLHPLWTIVGRVAGRAAKLATVGTMPPEVRAILEQPWSRADEIRLRALFAIIRPIHRRLPERLRYLPLAVHARRHARSVAAIKRRALTSFV